MSFKNGCIIIILLLSIFMTKIKIANGRISEGKFKKHAEMNKLHHFNLQTRHYNHYLHKKHHKCTLDRLYYRPQGHLRKPSRYPTLDKIVDRLDNQIDHRLERLRAATTYNPFDEWNVTKPNATTFPDKRNKYAYVTVGLGDSTTTKTVTQVPSANRQGKYDWIRQDVDFELGVEDRGYTFNKIASDTTTTTSSSSTTTTTTTTAPTTTVNSNNKEFMQDFTTSSPWESEQHDIGPQGVRDAKDSNNSDVTFSKLPTQTSLTKESWALSRLVPRVTGDDRRKKTTPMPYVAAHEHYEQVLRLADCHIPKEKVIRVHEVHPDPSKSYSPSCTILHQCGDDTGCCRDLKQVCKPKNTTKVELYFFTTTLGKPQTVEKLHFVNHTECECQRRTDESMPRDSEFRKSHFKKFMNAKINEEKRKISNCTCPSRYSSRYFQNGTCVCDCFDKQDDCLLLKKGKDHFSYHDKLCIQQGTCLLPSCEFGSYIRQFGRCPNRSEKYHYSWTRSFSYRDLVT